MGSPIHNPLVLSGLKYRSYNNFKRLLANGCGITSVFASAIAVLTKHLLDLDIIETNGNPNYRIRETDAG
jgi:hypothetical protein